MDATRLETLGLGLGFDLERRDGGQISHGLNLVLKLKNPLAMPLLLIKIRQAQRKINAGLGELNFVHYARFLPTHDNTALQVITEFDGPLAPYVLDFAIEIGDVFDVLLSFTQGTEQIVPVAEHAAEFLAFVEEHNKVSVAGVKFPDWALYAAYPEQTVLDIVGPRNDLPIPKADRPATPVERDDVQGNILRGYRARRVRHFVLRVSDARLARTWLADKATPDTGAAAVVPQVMTSLIWAPRQKPDLMLNIGLTYAGMKALKIRPSWHEAFPAAFKQGALDRAADNFDIGDNAPDGWMLGGPREAGDIHVMVSLYHSDGPGAPAKFELAATELVASLLGAGLELMAKHDAIYNNGNSWLGYADGIANPRLASACPVPHEREDLQPAVGVGEFVLGKDYKNIYGGSSLGSLPEALASNGSFCAVRVLAQDVAGFEAAITSEAARLGVNADLLKAKLMGRWIDGAPLSLYPNASPGKNKRNDFDYAPSYEYPGTSMDHDGNTCPVGAHIRRTNPRTSRVAGARYARRLMRRGMHYEIKDPHGLRLEVGLFGMFMCGDLERQFEFIQRQWINGDRFAPGLRGTRDPFVGTPEGKLLTFEVPMANGPALQVRLPQIVRTRGSLYLFMPGLNSLRQLDQFASVEPPLTAPVPPPPTPGPEDILGEAMRALQAAPGAIGAILTESALIGIARAALGHPPLVASEPAASLQNLHFDPRRREFQIDPYPFFARMRAEDSVHYSPLYDGWFVFGYCDVVDVCTKNDDFSAAPLGGKSPRGLFTLDDPEHATVRAKVEAAWRQAAVGTAAFVQRSIDKTFAALGTRPCFDLVDDFARPVPRDVYYDILGGKAIDAGERRVLDALARRVMKHHDPLLDDLQRLDGALAGLELAARLGRMLALAALPPWPYKGSFLGHLAPAVDLLGGPFGPVAAVTTLVNLTVAGYMSVEFLLATGIRRLLLDGEKHWRDLQANMASLPDYLQEMRRTEHALAVVERFAKRDVKVGRVVIPKGRRVLGVLASANRDNVFDPYPEIFNPSRTLPPQPHLGLGHGTHECMGRYLENAITTPAINQLMAKMPGLRLQSNAQPRWFENFYFRSFDHLAVTTVPPGP